MYKLTDVRTNNGHRNVLKSEIWEMQYNCHRKWAYKGFLYFEMKISVFTFTNKNISFNN